MIYLSILKQMTDTCDYLDCPCTMYTNPESSKIEEDEEWKGIVSEVCKWPRLHKDAAIAIEKGTYMDVNIGIVKPTEWRTRAGRQAHQDWLDTNVQGIIEKVKNRGINLLNFLIDGLQEKVYEKNEITYIENCRRILDIQSHVRKIQENGAVMIARFRNVAVFLESNIDVRADSEEL